MKRILQTVLTICFAIPLLAGEPDHFSLPYSGYGTNHMNFYFMKATVGGADLQAGDEIAVFDGNVCAGAVQLEGVLPSSSPYLLIAASAAEPGITPINGYTNGNEVSVRIWDASTQTEYQADLLFFNTQNNVIDPVPFAEGTAAYLKISAPVPVTIDLTAEDKEYDGDASASVDYTVSEGTFSGDVTVSVTNGAFNDKNVGEDKSVTADIEVGGDDVVHYDFTLNESTTASITPKPVSVINAAAQNKNYDGTTEATISGAALSGIISPDDVQLTQATSGTFAQAGIGSSLSVTTAMDLTGSGSGNYQLTGQPSGLTADITKAPLTVTADNQTKTYGDPVPELTLSYSGFAGNEDASVLDSEPVASTGLDQNTNAGVYSDAITVSGGVGTNYDFIYISGDFEVTKALLTVDADNKAKVYGEPNPPLTYQCSGFVLGQDASVIDMLPSATTVAHLNSNTGFYSITVSGGEDANYEFHYVTGYLQITKATAEVMLSALTKTYNGEPLPVTVTTNPAGLAVNITYDGQTEVPVDIGEYTVLAVIEDQNYQGSAEGTLRIFDNEAPTIDDSGLADLTIVCGSDYEQQLEQWLQANAGAVAADESGIERWSYDFDPAVLNEICGTEDTSVVVHFTVEDTEGNKASIEAMLHVRMNEGPFLINPIPDQVIHASYELVIPLSRVSGIIFDDVNDPELLLDIMVEDTDTLPHWAAVIDDTLFCAPMIADTGCVNIVVVASDPYGATASDTFQVCVDGYPVHAWDIEASLPEVNMYPNPTQGIVHINPDAIAVGDIELSVLNIAGQQVLRKKFSAAEPITFSMADHVSGIYFVQLGFKDIRITKKLIVDRK